MSGSAGETAVGGPAPDAPTESLKRELEEPEAGETEAKRVHVDTPATETEAPAAITETAAVEPKSEPAPESTATLAADSPVQNDAAVGGTAEVPAVAAPDIAVRLLMTNKMVGMVIGKGGEKIRRVRETSGCHITFSDNYPGVTDRVLMVTGQYEHVKAAMHVIVVQLEQDVIISGATLPTPIQAGQLTLKLLCPQSQIGAVIGKGGSQLERMRTISGAQISAASEPLPGSTDRPVSITGTAEGIVHCIDACMEIFQANPAGSGQVQYRPQPAPTAGYAGYGPQPGQYGAPRGAPPMGGQGYGAPGGAPGGYAPPPQHQQPQTMQQFTIANDLVGCVIGRGGSEINAMRKQSGAQIRIHHPEPNNTERLVSVSGTQEQVAMAHFLLTNKLQQEVSNNWAPGSGTPQQHQAMPPQQQQQPYY